MTRLPRQRRFSVQKYYIFFEYARVRCIFFAKKRIYACVYAIFVVPLQAIYESKSSNHIAVMPERGSYVGG